MSTTTTLTDKIKDEIFDMQKRRHELSMRKLAFTTGLLGIGTLAMKLEEGWDLSYLLYLVPFIAISFDVHILTEEFRIKRAGEFILHRLSRPTDEEVRWEQFFRKYPSTVAPLQHLLVTTLVITLVAAFIASKSGVEDSFFWVWLSLCVCAEVVITYRSSQLRARLIAPAEKAE